MSLKRFGLALGLVALWFLLDPDTALAWAPGTHVYLGEAILGNLRLLPPAIAALIQAFPYDYLYGNIAPDASIAKKYVPAGRHSHFWTVGRETFDLARSDAIRAFGLGYLSHLAADTIAHNYFVPRQLVLTPTTRSMGHTYWESRVETQVGSRWVRKARELLHLDHQAAHRHLERIISPTIFSVRTNRRIFHGMVRLSHTRGFQRAMQAASERSRWLLNEEDVERHLQIAYDVTVELLARAEQGLTGAQAMTLDPNGAQALRAAKRLRRKELGLGTLGSPSRLLELAEDRFGARPRNGSYWARSEISRPWDSRNGIAHAPASGPLVSLAGE
ncbi:MAG TPA: zinc dependent phospholipase C family protein [Gemmatimonadales bacterium]|nr:zinc dependent phospholipase C family protein [Gemmatimonadales bacterium]